MGLSQSDIDALLSADAEEAPSSASEAHETEDSGSPSAVTAVLPRRSVSISQAEIERIKQLSVPISVKLAERLSKIRTIITLTVGSIIEFNVPADSELELVAGTETIGKGQAVKVGENFGLRISRMGTLQERVQAMGSDA